MAATPTFLRGEAQFPQKAASTPIAAGDLNIPSSNTLCTLTYDAPGGGKVNEIHGVWYSYSAAPTAGKLQIKDGSTVVFDQDVTAAGPGSVVFAQPRRISANAILTVLLAAGGNTIQGKLNAQVVAVQ